jgi:hypothetical protein
MESRFGHDPSSGARWEVWGPTEGAQVVEAWADGHIPFEPKLAWQKDLRSEIRSRCRLLEPPADEILDTAFFGPMPDRSDVENLVLFNIDDSANSFEQSGRNGIRFSYGAELPPAAPSGDSYKNCYRYRFTPRVRTLASFEHDWIDLGGFDGDKKLAQVWLALAHGFNTGTVRISSPGIGPDEEFAVNIAIRSPHGEKWSLGKLVKPIVDGVISAFHAHTDATDLSEIVGRLAKQLRADPVMIKGYLLDRRRAVLGDVPRLIYLRGDGVQWNPSDHLCTVGELLAGETEPGDRSWAIKGRIVTVFG